MPRLPTSFVQRESIAIERLAWAFAISYIGHAEEGRRLGLFESFTRGIGVRLSAVGAVGGAVLAVGGAAAGALVGCGAGAISGDGCVKGASVGATAGAIPGSFVASTSIASAESLMNSEANDLNLLQTVGNLGQDVVDNTISNACDAINCAAGLRGNDEDVKEAFLSKNWLNLNRQLERGTPYEFFIRELVADDSISPFSN